MEERTYGQGYNAGEKRGARKERERLIEELRNPLAASVKVAIQRHNEYLKRQGRYFN